MSPLRERLQTLVASASTPPSPLPVGLPGPGCPSSSTASRRVGRPRQSQAPRQSPLQPPPLLPLALPTPPLPAPPPPPSLPALLLLALLLPLPASPPLVQPTERREQTSGHHRPRLTPTP